MKAIVWQLLQIILVVGISPLITGWVRLVKSRLNGRLGASPFQPYRDIYRLLQKEAVIAHSASWVFRVAPYVTFGAVWLAASGVPAFTTNLFIAFVLSGGVGIEVSLGLALVALLMVAIAENGRIPIDNPATHLELTMVHEAMVLEYSGRHLALMEGASMVRLTLFMALIGGLFAPWGMAQPGDGSLAVLIGLGSFAAKCFILATALGVFETSIAKMRVFRYADFLGGALLLGLLATIFLYVSEAV